ncbi:MAG: prepilin-type N-terminal cleavage/methylation domain-containing protein [Gammaproteobacteria bacterium]|nr:prepilin-type N-terminal cleavage/methylation domain-containing protein [Gammaproteobacteria bacterium]
MLSVRKQIGFSLIELMIVVSIIGILTMIALPTYHHYLKRARFAEVIAFVGVYKTAVALALQQGIMPTDIANEHYGIPPAPHPTANLASLIVKNGVITATATQLLFSATLILKPNIEGTHFTLSGTCLRLGLCHE